MLKNRFLSVFALAFAAGIAVCFLAGTDGKAVSFLWCAALAAVVVGCYLAACVRKKELKPLLLYPLLVSVGLFCGFGWLCLRALPYERLTPYLGQSDTVSGIVAESGSSEESAYFDLTVDRSKLALPQGTTVRIHGNTTARIGDRAEVSLTYDGLSTAQQRGSGVDLVANGRVLSVGDGEGVVNAVRRFVANACETLYAPYGASGVAQALTVRERSSLSASLVEAYRNAGLSHVLAISGLHLTILVLALQKILTLLRVRKQIRDGAALLLLLFYCLLTGFSPSVVRASVMLGFVLIGGMVLYRIDSLTTLFCALLLLLLADPYALLSAGLQLSFLSCLGILLFQTQSDRLRRRILGSSRAKHPHLRKLASELTDILLTSALAILFTFPVTVFSFGSVSWFALFGNLLVLPLVSPLLFLLFLSVAVFPLSGVLAQGVAFLPGQVLRVLHGGLLFLSAHRVGSVDVPLSVVAIPFAVSVCAILAALLFRRYGLRELAAVFGVFAVSLTLCLLLAPSAGSTDGLLVVSAEQRYALVSERDECALVDLGGTELTLPELQAELPACVYIVTEANDVAYERLCEALSVLQIRKLYLPETGTDGVKNDLSAWKALANRENCAILTYHYALDVGVLRYDAQDGAVFSRAGTAVLLFGTKIVPCSGVTVLLPTYAGKLPEGEVYVPVDWTGSAWGSDPHWYSSVLILQNGKEVSP